MEKLHTIRNEAEFQQWLAEVLKAERNRLRMRSVEGEFPSGKYFEVVMEDPAKEKQPHEDER